ncbi:unnamed protein product [Polarella glacialis]|uniref:Uncharacterized protein n=1 Tax=Polarella glacialis TaxID=89957 RepID=A0A813K5M1_POLGL|nr:unnamed protein product [Polarella glacialis]
MPWDGSPLAAIVLGSGGSLPWLASPMHVSSQPMLIGPRARQSGTVAYMPKVRAKRRRLMDRAANMTIDDARARVFSGWLVVIEHNAHASRVGRQILACQESEDGESSVHEPMEDLFASKSTSTLSLRFTAIQMYLSERIKADPGKLFLLIVEQELYDHLSALRKAGKPATRASSLLQAWNFMIHVVGFVDTDASATSPRCIGSAHRQFLGKKPLRQKAALSALMVFALELVTISAACPVASVEAGFVCLCALGRLRVSDASRIKFIDQEPLLDSGVLVGGFLEAAAVSTKTAQSKEKKTTFLPIVVPMYGLSGQNWWQAFIEARRSLGMPELVSAAEGELSAILAEAVPLLPKRLYDRVWSAQPARADEVTATLLRLLSSVGCEPAVLKKVASHSMKATLLSMAAKFGVDLRTRQLLGYHVVKGEESALNYGRDNLGAPVHELEKMLDAIRAGSFLPDEVRAKRRPLERGVDVKSLKQQFEDWQGCSVEAFLRCHTTKSAEKESRPEKRALSELSRNLP